MAPRRGRHLDLGHVRRDAGQRAGRSRRSGRRRPPGRMAEDVALMADLGSAPTGSRSRGRGCSRRGRPGEPGRARLLPGPGRRAGRRTTSSRSSPSTTGISRRSWRTRGGWPARDTASRFGDYARVVGHAIGDQVVRWSTLNEPWCAAFLGYASGVHAPGRTDAAAAVAAAHHLLLAHGIGVDALRSEIAEPAAVGLTVNPYPVVAAGDRPEDHEAARRVDGLANRIWYDPVLRGRYPDDLVDDLLPLGLLAVIRDGDLAQISRPIDGLGLNYYRRHHVRHRPARRPPPASEWAGSDDIELVEPPGPNTEGGWAIEPDGLTEVLQDVAGYDPPPLWIDECGAAFRRRPMPTGSSTTPVGPTSSPATSTPRVPPRGRRRRPWLLRLEPARQLRVGRGLRPPLRHRPRRLHHAERARPRRAPAGTRTRSASTATADRTRAGTSEARTYLARPWLLCRTPPGAGREAQGTTRRPRRGWRDLVRLLGGAERSGWFPIIRTALRPDANGAPRRALRCRARVAGRQPTTVSPRPSSGRRA